MFGNYNMGKNGTDVSGLKSFGNIERGISFTNALLGRLSEDFPSEEFLFEIEPILSYNYNTDMNEESMHGRIYHVACKKFLRIIPFRVKTELAHVISESGVYAMPLALVGSDDPQGMADIYTLCYEEVSRMRSIRAVGRGSAVIIGNTRFSEAVRRNVTNLYHLAGWETRVFYPNKSDW